MIHYGALLQNATDIITKCDSYFITRYDNYNKMRCLLQITTVESVYENFHLFKDLENLVSINLFRQLLIPLFFNYWLHGLIIGKRPKVIEVVKFL